MNLHLQCASDLHLEKRPRRFLQLLKPSSDILVLAGNIGYPDKNIYDQFLHWCSLKFKYVILVAGNCEYYGSTISKIDRVLKQLCKKHGVYLLENGVLEIQGIVFLGTTLWFEIPDDISCDISKNADYHYIKDFSPQISHEMYIKNSKWLEEQVKLYNGTHRIVVITHHAPVNTIEGVDIWIHGHTQQNTTFKIGSTIVTTNQYRPVEGEKYSKKFIVKNEKNTELFN